MSGVTPGVFFELEGALPRGRHKIPAERIAEVQRARFVVAATELLSDRPLPAIATTDIARHAHVSLAAFYTLFADKQDCALAAYRRFSTRLAEHVLIARGSAAGTLTEHVDTLVGAYFGALQADPVSARAFLVHLDVSEAEVRRRRQVALRAFVTMLDASYDDARATDPRLDPLPPEAHATIVHTMRRLACEELERGGEPDLLRHIAPMRELTLALYAGAGAPDGAAWSCRQGDFALG